MTEIEKSKPVFVSGANGYVASWLVKQLLENGLTVHAAVRDPQNSKKVGHLQELAKDSQGELKLFKSDLLSPNSYQEAMQGCELVYHTASPFVLDVKNPQTDLIDPAVKGTENILNTVNQTPSVKRVVLTSSCAAIYTDAIDTQNTPDQKITEEVWNTTASIDYQPYSYSKTLAEKKAWEMNKNTSWDLVTINPSLVLGPALNATAITSESYNILKQMGDGTMKAGAPKMGIGLVDVRDVANAHYLAGFTPEAKGRYITSAHNTDFLEMALSLQKKYGDKYPLPKKALPKFILVLFGPLINKAFSRKMLRNNININFTADNQKIKSELDVSFRSLKETMEDSFQTLIDANIIKAK